MSESFRFKAHYEPVRLNANGYDDSIRESARPQGIVRFGFGHSSQKGIADSSAIETAGCPINRLGEKQNTWIHNPKGADAESIF
jgi:hypothetical protein